MTADIFISELESLAPSKVALINNWGLTAHEAESFRRSYYCTRRSGRAVKPSEPSDNPILDLIANYDLRNVEIAGLTFKRTIEPCGEHIAFGQFEGDLLALDRSNRVVLVSSDSNHVLTSCAKDPSSFLSAMIEVSTHISASCSDPSIQDDIDLKRKAANRAAALAGGPEYSSFYSTALGVFEQ